MAASSIVSWDPVLRIVFARKIDGRFDHDQTFALSPWTANRLREPKKPALRQPNPRNDAPVSRGGGLNPQSRTLDPIHGRARRCDAVDRRGDSRFNGFGFPHKVDAARRLAASTLACAEMEPRAGTGALAKRSTENRAHRDDTTAAAVRR
jgi:hypothetical protein